MADLKPEHQLDIVDRLRGKVRVPINDGMGAVTPGGSEDFFERQFPTSNLAREAADYIERLRKDNATPTEKQACNYCIGTGVNSSMRPETAGNCDHCGGSGLEPPANLDEGGENA